MTGEITLRGRVLPVGGIKEKVIAAHRAGLKTIILPSRNEKDLDELPDDVRKQLTFVFAEEVFDVFNAALGKAVVRVPSGNGHSAEEPEAKQKSPRAAKKST